MKQRKGPTPKRGIRQYIKSLQGEEPPENRVELIQEAVAQGADPIQAMNDSMEHFGFFKPVDARKLAQEYAANVPATDNFIYNNTPAEVGEREAKANFRRSRLYDALAHIAREALTPQEEAYDIPDYQRHRVEEYIGPSIDWLIAFKKAWEERWEQP